MGIVAGACHVAVPWASVTPVEQRFPLRVGPLRDGALDADAGSAAGALVDREVNDEARSRGLLGGASARSVTWTRIHERGSRRPAAVFRRVRARLALAAGRNARCGSRSSPNVAALPSAGASGELDDAETAVRAESLDLVGEFAAVDRLIGAR